MQKFSNHILWKVCPIPSIYSSTLIQILEPNLGPPQALLSTDNFRPGWRMPVFCVPPLLSLLANTHCPYPHQWNNLILCWYTVMYHHNKVWGRSMSGWPDSVFGRTHIDSIGTHSIENFIDVVLQLEPPILPMVSCPLPPHNFHLAFPPDILSTQNREDRT